MHYRRDGNSGCSLAAVNGVVLATSTASSPVQRAMGEPVHGGPMNPNHIPDIPVSRRIIFPRQVKTRLFHAQRGRCSYCGRNHSSNYLEIDHKLPLIRDGGNDIGNLQLLCRACNLRKGIQTDEEFRDRYWRLLPTDGSIPASPIPQGDISGETQRTRAAPEVRRIYYDRFSRHRIHHQGLSRFWVYVVMFIVVAIMLATGLTLECNSPL